MSDLRLTAMNRLPREVTCYVREFHAALLNLVEQRGDINSWSVDYVMRDSTFMIILRVRVGETLTTNSKMINLPMKLDPQNFAVCDALDAVEEIRRHLDKERN